MDLHLEGCVAIVTGASKGIGRAIAEGLAAEGVSVLAVARQSEALLDLAQHASGRIAPLACDVTDREAVAKLPDEAVARFGRLDILVNNAGGARMGPFLNQSWADWDWHMTINVKAPAVLSQAAGKYFVEQRSGKIINIASTAAVHGFARLAPYCTAKGALVQLTRALAVEWAPFGVHVNVIGPGTFQTEATRPLWEKPNDRLALALAHIPTGRIGKPEEVATLTCFLASHLADHITGQLIMIDGGQTAAS